MKDQDLSDNLTMQTFSKQLHRLLLEKQMSQSDLARTVWGTTTDSRGYKVAKNWDRISAYLAGRSLPDQRNLLRIAKALGVEPETLAPEKAGALEERDNPEIAMTVLAGHTDMVHLRVNKLVPLSLAAEVISLLSKSDKGT